MAPLRSRDQSAPRLVCLLPVRNAAETLPGWLDAAASFADAVIALDDGSTDDTGAILAAHPMVAITLSNDRREGHLGWHDGRNRNRLLAAASDLRPDWIFSLDADERMDETDAAALRRFIETDAIAGCAYGFQIFRMASAHSYDPNYEWVYRLFAFDPSQRFVNRRLDFTPVPVSIGSERFVPTTIRIQHFGEPDQVARAQRTKKFREADPEGAFRSYWDHLAPHSPGPLPIWAPRAPETPILMGAGREPATASRPYVACLLPARNCAHLLPGWFESVSRVADAIVALDDGSSDETGKLLREHPLVVTVLTSPPRPPGFSDWDDGVNRNRLLAAAAELHPTWILSVDADERIPLEDAAALRRFLGSEALPGYGYSFASYRMIDDEDHYDRLDYDAYRLFAFEPGQEFPTDRLHAPPIPVSIPPTNWRQTTIRMKHLVSLTETARQARRDKFSQADPDCVWEPDYAYTIEPPGPVKRWESRALGQPVVVQHDGHATDTDDLDLDGPILTVAIVVHPGEERDASALIRDLKAVQDDRVEVMVATRDGFVVEVVQRDAKPDVVVSIPPEQTDAGLRNIVLYRARGDYVTFLAVGVSLTADALEEINGAHESGHGAIAARAADLPTSPAAWASVVLATVGPRVVFTSFARERLWTLGGFDELAGDVWGEVAARSLADAGLPSVELEGVVLRRSSGSGIPAIVRRQYEIARRRPSEIQRSSTRSALRRLNKFDDDLGTPRRLVAAIVVASGVAGRIGRVASLIGRRRS